MSNNANSVRILARNTVWNYAGFVISIATNLVMFPFVVNRLGDAAVGVWLLVGAVTGYMGLLELGIVPSLTQTIASALARNERWAVSRAASSAEALLISLAGASLLLLPLAPFLVQVLRIPDTLQVEALLAFRIALVGFALRMPLAMFQAVLLGHQRQDRCNQLWIVLGLAKLTAAAAVLGAGYGLVALVTSEMVLHLLAGILQITWVYQEHPELRLTWQLVNRDEVRRLLSFGGAVLAVSICSLVIEQTDRLVIAAFLPIAMVTHYAAAWKIYMLSYMVTTTLVQAVSPVAADLFGRNDFAGLRRLFLLSTKYTVALAWPLVLTLAFSGGFLLRAWMGARFVGALPIVQILLLAFAVTALNYAGYSTLSGMRRVGPTVARYFAPQAVLNLLLSVWLIRRFGNVGVALGTLVPAVLLEYWFLKFVLSELQVPWREFLQSVRPVGTAAFVTYLPLMLAYLRLPADSALLPAVALVCSLAYALVLWQRLHDWEKSAVLAYVPAGLRYRGRTQLAGEPARPDQQA